MDINTNTISPRLLKKRSATASLILCTLLISKLGFAETNLSPYTASYSTKFNGISATLEQNLKKTDNEHWSLSNKTNVLFASLIEETSFLLCNNKLQPVKYHYGNSFSSKRDSKLHFDWENGTVTETARPTEPLKLPDDALDNLSFQLQLRLDLVNQGIEFKEKTYTLVDREKLKTFVISYQGEESITVPAGTFTAIKLKQQRPNKEKYINIWLAKEWDYFLLQIERIEKNKSRYKIKLETASTGAQNMVVAKSLSLIKSKTSVANSK